MLRKVLVFVIFTFSLHAMQKGRNKISEKLSFSDQVSYRMAKYRVTEAEVRVVAETDIRSWDSEEQGIERFTERMNRINPLIVYLKRDEQPNVVVAVFKEELPKQRRIPYLRKKKLRS